MKLLRGVEGAPDGTLMEALSACVAHRCPEHNGWPPLNMNEGGGSSECGVCAGTTIAQRIIEPAMDQLRVEELYPVLDGYAARLTHHAVLMDKLREVRDRLMLAGLAYGDIDAVLMGGE